MKAKSLFSKRGVAVLALTGALSLSFVPRRSQALVVITGATITGGTIALVAALTSGLVILGETSSVVNHQESIGRAIKHYFFAEGILAGLIFLDDSNNPNPRFLAVDDQTAEKVGLTDAEKKAYNESDNLAQVNAIFQTAMADGQKLIAAGTADVQDAERASLQELEQAKASLNVDVASAMTKIQAYVAQNSKINQN